MSGFGDCAQGADEIVLRQRSINLASINQSESVLLPNQITVDRAQLSELDEMLVDNRDFHFRKDLFACLPNFGSIGSHSFRRSVRRRATNIYRVPPSETARKTPVAATD
jgi:hypothetical protein